MKNKLLSLLLALTMAWNLLPTAALALPAEETLSSQLETVVETFSVPEEDANPEGLLTGYLAQQIYGEDFGASLYQESGKAAFAQDSLEWKLYSILRTKLESIAAEGGKTNKIEITAEEIGFANQIPYDANNTEIKNDFESRMTSVFRHLVTDLTYDLYWFDKSTSGAFSYQFAISGGKISSWEFAFKVSQDYRATETDVYTVTSDVTKVTDATKNAKEIIARHANELDYTKLLSYKDEICKLVDYNYEAAKNDSTPYGNPWQLIWVFDGDPDTKVVCEGYAKAFQFLCDYSQFDGDVECFTVSGIMGGGTGAGGHMWNIVRIDGKSYLVDVTNSDQGSVGQDGSLFMVGGQPESGSYETKDLKYAFKTVTFEYYNGSPSSHTDQYSLWGSMDILTLDVKNYISEPSKLDSLEILYDGKVVTDSVSLAIPAEVETSYLFTVQAKDQYGAVMDPTNLNWGLNPTSSDATVTLQETDNPAEVKISVSPNAQATSAYTLSVSENNINASIKLNLSALNIVWPEVKDDKAPCQYGNYWKEILSMSDGSANIGGKEVKGTFSLEGVDRIAEVGDHNKQYSIIFVDDDGHYNVTKTDNFPQVAPKPLTLTINSDKREYGAENPKFEVTVPKSELVYATDINELKYQLTTKATVNSKVGDYDITGEDAGTVNYALTLTKGTLTVTPATITEVKTPDLNTTIQANNAANTQTGLKSAANLPDIADIYYGDNKTATANVTWTGPAEKFDPKGGTYTFTGTVEAGENFEPYTGKPLTAKLTVTPVEAKLSFDVDDVKTISVAEAQKDWKQGLPSQLTVAYSASDAQNPTAVQITDWTAKPSIESAIAEVNKGNDQAVELTPQYKGLPDWATVGDLPIFTLKITQKFPVEVTLTTQFEQFYIYGDKLPKPEAVQAPYEHGTDTNGKYKFYYKSESYPQSEIAPTDVGEYMVWAELDSDTHSGSSQPQKFVITPRQITLTWGGYDARNYDGKPSNVQAALPDTISGVTVTVTGGGAVNASDKPYTAEATLSSANYEPANPKQEYVINKANRNLQLTQDLLLYPEHLTETPAKYEDLDGSAKPEYTLTGDITAVTRKGDLFTAVGNGEAKVQITIPATENYTEAQEQIGYIHSYPQPIARIWDVVTDNLDENNPDQLAATLSADGKTILVTGVKRENSEITGWKIEPSELDSPYDAATKTLTMKYHDQTLAVYTVDLSGLVALPDKVELKENLVTTDVSDSFKGNNTDKAAVETALRDTANNKLEGALASAAKQLTQAAKDAQTGENQDKVIEVQVTLSIEAKSLETIDNRTSYVIEVQPQYQLMAKDDNNSKNEKPVSDLKTLPNEWLTTPVTVSIKLPASLNDAVKNDANLFVKHTKANNQVEYLSATVNNGVASWQMSSFSEVELYVSERTVTVTFIKDGTEQTVIYNESNRNDKLPGQDGWTIKGKTYTTVAQLLDDASITDTVEAKPVEKAPSNFIPGGFGGGSSNTYSVSAKPMENGSLSFSTASAKQGDTVTITPKPDQGYQLESLTLTDSQGQQITLQKQSDGTYTFTMPGRAVTAQAKFVKAEQQPAQAPFTDIDASWAKDAILWAYQHGYVNGTSTTTFTPDGNITRQQMWMILARLNGQQPADMEQARAWAMSTSVSDGTNGANPVSRQQMVTFLYRYAQLMGYSVEQQGDLSRFTDSAAVADYAQSAMAWAVQQGLVNGVSADTLAPAGTATRAQFVTILQRFYGQVLQQD